MVTIFENILTIDNPKIVRMESVLDAIRSGRYKDKIDKIRSCKTEEEKRRLKANLPCVLFTGEFNKPIEKVNASGVKYISYRDDKSITKHSGFVPIDIDNVENIDELREELINDPIVYALWVSASGKGLHGLIKIGDGNKHTEHYRALIKRIKGLDTTAQNVARVLYISHDPDIYINTSASVFYDVDIEEEKKYSKVITGDGNTDYKKVDIACRMVRSAPDGQKHHVLLRASNLLGGYVATKTVEYDVAYNILSHEIRKRNIEDPRLAEKTIEDGLRHGMTKPIQEIEQDFKEAVRELGAMEEELSFLSNNSKDDDFIYKFRTGLIPMGLPLGYYDLDQNFRLKEGEFYASLAHSHIGKAQPLSSSVLTPIGWKKFGDIKIGDDIVGVDGKRQKVIGVFPQGEREVYKVRISDGTVVYCDKKHIWSVNKYTMRHRGLRDKDGVNRYVPNLDFINITLEDMIGKEKVNGKRKNSVNNFMLPRISPVEFNEKLVSIEPYTLGALLGDGTMTKSNSVSVCGKDCEVFDLLSESKYFRKMLIQKRDRRELIVAKFSNEIVAELVNLNLYGCFSDTKFIPDLYKYNSVQTRIDVLKGLMDTDGTVNKTGSMIFTTVSKRLCDDVVEIVNSLGGRALVKSSVKKYRYNGELLSGKLSYNVSIRLPDLIIPFTIKRKIDRINKNRKTDVNKYIESIEYSHKEECLCIKVSNPDSLYITDNYIPTHNTTVNLWFLFLSAIKYDWNWMVYTGENQSASVKMKIMEFFVGKRISQMSDREHNIALKFVDEHFFMMSTDNMYSYKDLLEHAKVLMAYKSLKGVFIDPYNSLMMELTVAKNKYIYDYEAYSEMLNFTKKYNTTIFLSVHTTTASQRDRDSSGNQKMPHASDTEGGAALYNRSDNFMTLHRKIKDPNEWMFTEISIDKVRNRETGGKPTSQGSPIRLRMVNGIEFVDDNDYLPFNREQLLIKHKLL